MVTQAQIQFFSKLLEEKDFGGKDRTALAEEFLTLNKRSASAWIERALQLPKLDESNEEVRAPAF